MKNKSNLLLSLHVDPVKYSIHNLSVIKHTSSLLKENQQFTFIKIIYQNICLNHFAVIAGGSDTSLSCFNLFSSLCSKNNWALQGLTTGCT